MREYRILLADDHTMLRKGIRKIIEEKRDLRVVGEASDGLKLLGILGNVRPDMIVLDLSMPHLHGIQAIPEIKRTSPSVKILVLTMYKSKEFLYHAFTAGAEGYLLKEDADSELFSAIDTIRRGGTYISPILSVELASELARSCRRRDDCSPARQLTAREVEVLQLIAEGKTTKQIAEQLCISVHTVHHHRENILHKLRIKKVANLVKYAIRHGYVSIGT